MKKLFLIWVIVFCSLNVFAAIQEIEIFETGDAYIEGTAEVAVLEEVTLNEGIVKGYTWELVSKKGSDWTFSYKIPLESEYDIYVKFPEDSEIYNIEVSGNFGITSLGSSPVVHLTGNDSLSVEITYRLSSHEEKASFLFIYLILFLALVVVISFIVIKKKPKNVNHKLNIEKFDAVKLTLNENQLQIIDALLQKNGEASQTVIQYSSGLPKSSLSRNIELLSQKEVVVKYSNGNSNYIKLHPRFYD